MRIEYKFIRLFGNTVIKDRGAAEYRGRRRQASFVRIFREGGYGYKERRKGGGGITVAEAPAGNPL